MHCVSENFPQCETQKQGIVAWIEREGENRSLFQGLTPDPLPFIAFNTNFPPEHGEKGPLCLGRAAGCKLLVCKSKYLQK